MSNLEASISKEMKYLLLESILCTLSAPILWAPF